MKIILFFTCCVAEQCLKWKNSSHCELYTYFSHSDTLLVFIGWGICKCTDSTSKKKNYYTLFHCCLHFWGKVKSCINEEVRIIAYELQWYTAS